MGNIGTGEWGQIALERDHGRDRVARVRDPSRLVYPTRTAGPPSNLCLSLSRLAGASVNTNDFGRAWRGMLISEIRKKGSRD